MPDPIDVASLQYYPSQSLTQLLALYPDIEPEPQWKDDLRKQIEDGLSSVVGDAKRAYNVGLEKPIPHRMALTRQYNEAMAAIRTIAQREFKTALDKERRLRLWSHGLAENDDLNDALSKEQQSILGKILRGKTEDAQSQPKQDESSGERQQPPPTQPQQPQQQSQPPQRQQTQRPVEERRKEEEARLKEKEAKRMKEEARRKEEAARLKEEEAKRREEEARQFEEAIRHQEEEARLREEEARREEEAIRRKEEEAREVQEEYQKREEIRRRAEARKKQEENQKREEFRRAEEREENRWLPPRLTTGPGTGTTTINTGTNPRTSLDRRIWLPSRPPPDWSRGPPTSGTARVSTASASWINKPTVLPPTKSESASSLPELLAEHSHEFGMIEREWAHRQVELAKEQQEKFRREQERLERERQARAAASGRTPETRGGPYV